MAAATPRSRFQVPTVPPPGTVTLMECTGTVYDQVHVMVRIRPRSGEMRTDANLTGSLHPRCSLLSQPSLPFHSGPRSLPSASPIAPSALSCAALRSLAYNNGFRF
eukprot:3407598-Rhodomonas_salina.2